MKIEIIKNKTCPNCNSTNTDKIGYRETQGHLCMDCKVYTKVDGNMYRFNRYRSDYKFGGYLFEDHLVGKTLLVKDKKELIIKAIEPTKPKTVLRRRA